MTKGRRDAVGVEEVAAVADMILDRRRARAVLSRTTGLLANSALSL